jgi:glycosyltransferase involved in cell wall biosynthesis
MRILFLFDGIFPGPSAGAKRLAFYRKAIENEGLEVKVIPIQNKNINRFSSLTSMIMIPIKSIKTFYRERKKNDALFLYGFGWSTYILLSIIAKISGVKIYLEVNEKQGSLYGNRFTELFIVKKFNILMTNFSYLFFDGFVVISDSLENYIRRKSSRKARIIKIPILVDLNNSQINFSKPHGVNMPYVFHSGALSERKDGILEVFAAFAIACNALNKQLHFYLTSKIAPKDVLEQIDKIIFQNNIQENVHFLGNISENELLSYQKHCSMVIINKYINEQNLYNFPTKLGEFMIFEIPVITTAIGEISKYLVNDLNAYIFEPNNIYELSDKILNVLKYPSKSKQIGLNGKKLAENQFDYNLYGSHLVNLFSKKLQN